MLKVVELMSSEKRRDLHRLMVFLTPQNLSIEICIKKIVSICIYVKIALTKKKKKKKF